MEYEQKTQIYSEIKQALGKENSISLKDLEEQTKIPSQKLDMFLKDNLLYFLEEDMIKRQKEIKLKVLKMTSCKEIDIKILDMRKIIENELGEIAYLRFNQNEGHIVLPQTYADANQNLENKKLTIQEVEISFQQMTVDEQKEFSSNHGNHLEGILRSRFGRKVRFDVDGLLSHKSGIYLGSMKFKSLQDLKSIFTKVIKGSKPGDKVGKEEEQFLLDLMKYHEKKDEKLKDFDHFEVNLHPKFNETKCFFVVRKDGTKEDFSYVKCVKEISKLIK